MTPNQRKWHKIIWPLILVGILFSSWAAYQVLPESPVLSESTAIFSEESIEWSVNSENRQLTVVLKKPLATPSLLVYGSEKLENPIEQDLLLGEISGVKEYNFPLDSASAATPPQFLKFYNPIRKELLFGVTKK